MQACSQDIIVPEDQFYDNCFKGNIRSTTPCFNALSDLYECLLEFFGLSQSVWFSFYPCAFYSFKASFNTYLNYFTFLNLLQSTKI